VAARSWGGNSLRAARVLLPPQFIALWRSRGMVLSLAYRRVETLFARAGCFSISLAYTGFIAYLSFYHLVVELFARAGCFSSGLASSGFSGARCCPHQRATQQGIAPDCLTLDFSEMVRQRKCLWLRVVLLTRQPVNAGR
jgi:hypothetical protein